MNTVNFTLETFMPYRLAVLSERISRRLAEEYGASHGLGMAEWRVLAHLAEREKVSIRDIQRYVNMEKSRVSRAVSRLEAGKLVKKVTDPGDARLLAISLTSIGRRTFEEIVPELMAIEANLLSDLDARELAGFQEVMRKILKRLDEPDEPDAPDAPDAPDETGKVGRNRH
ncbi:MAG: MarR family transcriptional regulator [Gammaproteobacteria bacterium]|nr:MAG: MarR family transcriptional regulator [Gammaproteobacteria bacterium]